MDDLLSGLLSASDTSTRPTDTALITKAFNIAVLAHASQLRKSGEPFITHPVAVATTLARWNLDTTTIVAGLLHDTVEDGGATREDLVKDFGEDIAALVDGVTKVSSIHLVGSDQEEFVENLRKMLLAMAKDLRVVLVKLADRLHNMQTLRFLSAEKQADNAKETLEIYAPLAERLGMGEIKGELEDLAFSYLYPDAYTKLTAQTKVLFASGDKYIEKFRRELLTLLKLKLPDLVISVRHKFLYSLWKKLERPEIAGDLSKVYDLVAARILVDSVEQCYIALGLIHSKYHVVPYLGISDFIANPKSNGYQSIHTKVFGPEGRIVELQIRTHQMHKESEMGVAAHWQYASAKSSGVSDAKLGKGFTPAPQDKLSWVKQLAAWQTEITDNQAYLDSLRFDALATRNLVFSPKGDVYDLPTGATPVDFAYAVHTGLGHQVSGARVNGKMVGLNHSLQNGDVVEVLIDRKRKTPSHDWLDFVVTNTARHQIQKHLKT